MVSVSLSQFEGPLDLLLHLISRAKIDIKDIFISEITEQYLASVENLEGLDMEVASEFLQMAATLIEIKSRALLPKPPKREEEEEDPEAALVRRLEEYRKYKQAGEELKRLERSALDMLYRLPLEIVTEPNVQLNSISLDALQQAFLALLSRPAPVDAGQVGLRRIQRDSYTIAQGMMHIRARLREGEVSFTGLFTPGGSRGEIVTTFMAMLELLKANRITLWQEGPDGEIWIAAVQREEERGGTA